MVGTFDFSGKEVLVTGASSGIGLAVARGFATAGANLAILANRQEIYDAGKTLSGEIGRDVTVLHCDITDREMVSRALSPLTRIDVLINNAGLELITPIEERGTEVEKTFRRIIDINVMGTYYVTRDALKVMPAGSSMVFTASIWAKTAVAGFGAYCASKHANLGFMRSLAQELGPRGINVNAVCPGFIRTDASMRSVKAEAGRSGRSEQEVTDELLANQALPGLLEPEAVVSAYLFLASEHAKDIAGQTLHVDRGDVMD